MQVTHTYCAGIDVHKKIVVVCCLSEDDNGRLKREKLWATRFNLSLFQRLIHPTNL